ncbi:MAG: Hsp33 family molecular chaperone HslO [Clostridiales bacterium]|nr:Hsp33 family molecular chaperone HslO [Eubacteriales bacterium]MDH7566988.1 Hsp33 family molecular chaperone HslO [Clostridiales bacterium]
MEDHIVKATAAGGTIRALAAVTTDIVREAKEVHSLSPLASAALGRTLTAAAMMSRLLEGARDTITIQIRGDGPLGGIVTVSDSKSNVRGYVYNPQVYLPLNQEGKFDVAGAVGKKGYLNVIRDLGLKEPYIGYVNLVSGEIGDDIAYYYAFSEQIPSVVALGVLVDRDGSVLAAGGYIIQLMPGADEETVPFLENRVASVPSVTKLLHEGKTPEDILSLLLGDKDLNMGEKSPCRYVCDCTRDRMERNIISLGKDEIRDIIREQHGAELVCHFCNRKYRFSEDDLLKLLEG